jgi:phospholipid/cholesterol/gamma-HCH transport system substrate-binding protein
MNRARAVSYAALALAVVVVAVIVLSGGGTTGYTVRAEFRDVDGLRQGSTVKIDGVAAGTVTSLTVTSRSTAIATLTLDPGTGPVGAGASVQVRPTDLLGERYAQLDTGDQSRPLSPDSMIPLSRTSAPVDLDDVLNMLDAGTRARLRILINEAGIALAGRGADFNTLLSELPPNLGQTQQLLGQVASENASLENLISEGNRVTAAVSGKRDAMGHAIDVANQALDSVALKQAQLGQTISDAPGGLSALQTTLSGLGRTSDAIPAAAADLQQTAAPLTTTLRELPSFARSARQTLITAKRIAPQITRLGVRARSPLVALRPTAGALEQLAVAAAPILSEEDARGMRDLLWFIENWALALKGRDALGHFVGADLEVDPSILLSAVDSYVNNSGLSTSLNRRSAATGAQTAPAPGHAASSAPAAPSSSSSSSPSGSAPPSAGQPSSGASPTGVGNVVSGLLGTGGDSGAAQSTPAPSAGTSTNSVQQLLNFLIGK